MAGKDEAVSNGASGGENLEITINVNGREKWVPFPGVSDVYFFSQDDISGESVFEKIVSGSTVEIVGIQVGEMAILAVHGDEQKQIMVSVIASAESGKENVRVFTIKNGQFDYDEPETLKKIPKIVKNGVGTLKQPYCSIRFGKVEVQLGFTAVSRIAFNALIDFYKSKGGTAVLEESANNYKLQFDWGTIEASYFSVDKEAAIIATITE
jgi:hypothetical protein